MLDDRRQFKRFDIVLDVKFRERETSDYAAGLTKNFSREGLSFEAKNVDFPQKGILDFQLKHPKEDIFVSLIGNIAWREKDRDRYLIGIKLLEIQKEIKWDILDYAYDRWVVAERP
jgi:hypothetical protein